MDNLYAVYLSQSSSDIFLCVIEALDEIEAAEVAEDLGREIAGLFIRKDDFVYCNVMPLTIETNKSLSELDKEFYENPVEFLSEYCYRS